MKHTKQTVDILNLQQNYKLNDLIEKKKEYQKLKFCVK